MPEILGPTEVFNLLNEAGLVPEHCNEMIIHIVAGEVPRIYYNSFMDRKKWAQVLVPLAQGARVWTPVP